MADLSDYTQSLTLEQVGNGILGGHSSASAAGGLLSKLTEGLRPATVLVIGDSTGNQPIEWVYLYAQWLASKFPSYTVDYYLWGTTDYDAAEQIQEGSGSETLSIYNASIPGARPTTFSGSRLDNVAVAIPQADLVIINLGFNLTSGIGSINIETVGTPQFLELCGSVLTRHAAAGMLFLTQNPYRDDTTYLKTYSAIKGAAAILNADVADSYVEFLKRNKDPSLYADNTHPSPEGTTLYLEAVKRTHTALTPRAANNIFAYGYNLLSNGGFSDFTAPDAPANWTSANADFSEETTISEGPNGYSVRITKSESGAQSYINQNLSLPNLRLVRGGWLTLAVRMYIPAAQTTATVGRVALLTEGSTTNTYPPYSDTRDRWHWRLMSVYVPPTAPAVGVRIYADTATGGAGDIYVDRAVLVRGRTPADIY